MTTPKRGIEEMIEELKRIEFNVTGDGYWVEDEASVVMDALPVLLQVIEEMKKALEFYAKERLYTARSFDDMVDDCSALIRPCLVARAALERCEKMVGEK